MSFIKLYQLDSTMLDGEKDKKMINFLAIFITLSANFVMNLVKRRGAKGVTFYDSCYHSLALQIRGVYVTAAREYFKKARRKGIGILSC